MRALDLRARVLAAIGLVAVLQVVVAFAVITATRNQLLDQIDDRLAVAVSPERGDRFARGPGGRVDPRTDRTPGPARIERLGDTYEGVLGRDGQLTTYFSPNSTGAELPPPDVDLETAARANGRPVTVEATDGEVRYRLIALTSPGGASYLSAIPLDGVDATMARLTRVVGATVALVALVLALVAWWVLRLGIAPVKRMTATAGAIAAGDLSVRIADVDQRTEAGQLGHALNAMLGRIETSFAERTRAEDRLRRFIADASHELRTPVATIRGYAELYRAGGLAERGELDDAMRRTAQESQRMTRLIADMLSLAKLDRDPTLATRPVDLAALARDAVRDAQATHPERRIDAAVTADALIVSGDEDLLRQALGNLVGNAVVHTDPPAGVSVRASVDGPTALVEVVDDGAGMEPQTLERVTERFFRADPSRSRHKGGSGLGLAIVDSVAGAHHGRLRMASRPGHGTTASLAIPLAAGPAADAGPPGSGPTPGNLSATSRSVPTSRP